MLTVDNGVEDMHLPSRAPIRTCSDTNKKDLRIFIRNNLDCPQKVSGRLVMWKQLRSHVRKVVLPVIPPTNSLLVNPQPFSLLILRSFAIRNQDMATTASREGEHVTGGTESEEELEDKEVGKDTIGPTDHLKRHHLVDGVRSKHLNATTVLMEQLFLEIR